MSPNSHSHDDQESNKFVNSNRTFYNSVQKFIKKVKNTFKAQETQKIDNHIDAMKSGKKSHAVEFQDKALNFLKDVWIFFCKAARFIIKAFRTLFNIVKPHAIKAFNKTKTFFKKAHKVLIQNENGMLHFNKENQKESFCRIIGILSATLSLALTGALVYNFAKTYIANSKATYYWDQASYFTEASVACVILISLLLVITGIFLFTANQAKKENKVDVNININTSDEEVTKILLDRINELDEAKNFQKAVTESLLTEQSRLTSENQRLQHEINSHSFDLKKAFILGAAVAQNSAILNHN